MLCCRWGAEVPYHWCHTYGGAVPSSVSCRSAWVLALHARGAKVAVVVVVVVGVAVGAVAVVMGAAVGAVAGVAWSAG